MNYYPQYIHVPTTVPVQRYFADPHVFTNQYAWGGAPATAPTLTGPLGVSGVSGGQWMGIGDKLDVGVGKFLGKFGINTGASPVTGLGSGALDAIGDGVYNVLGGKNKTGVGNVLNAASKFTKYIPGVGKFAGLALNGIGALINRGWGSHRNAEGIDAFNTDTDALNQTRVTDSSNESIANQAAAQDWGGAFSYSDMGSTGWFNKDKFRDEFNRMMRARASGQNYMAANYDNAATNVQKNMMNNMLINAAAFGGPFDNPFSHPGSIAIAYGNEQQQLNNQRQMIEQMQNQNQNNYGIPMTISYGCGGPKCHCFGGNLFADGGITNSHGSDFTNDLMYIDAGGSHEDNPYQGVPMGHDSQGVPNVVEQGEIVVPGKTLGMESDFVISNRIPVSDEFAEKYPGTAGLTCAQAARKLTAESRENPNDIIAQNTDKVILRELVADQERTKSAQQQQMMQEAAIQQAMQMPPEQQMMAEQGQLQGPAMDEMAAPAAPEEYGIPMQPQMGAFGGSLNMFPYGGAPVTIKNKPAGNQYPSSKRDSYDALMANRVLQWVKDNITNGQSNEERMKDLSMLNSLQDAYYDAGMVTDDLSTKRRSDAIAKLQKTANDMGINDVFDDIDLSNYFNNHRGQNGDVSPTYYDTENGGMTGLRTAGYRGLIHPGVIEHLRSMGVNFTSDPTRGGMYYAEPMVEQSNTNIPKRDYLTEAELEAFQNDTNGNGEVYTPVGEGTNPESNTDDYYGSHAAGTRLYDESLRYAPIWASGIATLTDALGITNSPDYSAYNSLLSMARRGNGYMPVSYHPTGEQMRYMPYDPILQTITNNANTAATRRAIQDNSNGNAAMRNAALLPLNMQANLTNGQLGLQGRQYNDQLYNNVLTFNNGVNERNAHGILSADAQNAQNWAYQNRMFQANLASAIEARQAEKARVDAARSLNLSNFIKGLGALGKENAYYNMVNTNAANLGYGLYRGNGVMYNPWRIDQ